MRLSEVWFVRRPFGFAVAFIPLLLGLVVALLAAGGGPAAGAPPYCAPTPAPSPLPTEGPAALMPVCYPAGWNLVGGPTGFPEQLWLWNPATDEYQSVPTGVIGSPARIHGAWAYFPQSKAVIFAVPTPSNRATQQTLAAGLNLVSDPFGPEDAAFCDNTTGYAYDPTTGVYTQVTAIPFGSSVWVYAPTAASLELLPADAALLGGCPSPVTVTAGSGALLQVSRGLELQNIPMFTALFAAPSPWRLQYSYDCTAYLVSGGGSFFVSVLNPDGSTVDSPVSVVGTSGASNGAKSYQAAGSFYLQIDSACVWTVTVLAGP